ncbi:Ran guanine nucleotide release factor [Grifola frondosa]|uniref:Ran guanine nucleotide release factor n=1 Tax=Grifola frondosa TaxID=5627 RepID=A0A1C7MKC4_GRIFR|nr:Ran guanine nucleotide release factor [Grifola frondosa]
MSGSTKQLFGGAITVTLPPRLIDASDLRQVPNTQEVFLYPDSGISIIVEVLQSVKPTNLEEAAKAHFDALAHDNSAESQTISEVVSTSTQADNLTPAPVLLSGSQAVRKFNSLTADEIRILLALYRVQSKNADLVMSMNVPMSTANGEVVREEDWIAAKDAFNVAARSLRIVNIGLFA